MRLRKGLDTERALPVEDQKAAVERLPTPELLLRTSLIGSQHRKPREAPLPRWQRGNQSQLSPIGASRSQGGRIGKLSPLVPRPDSSPPISPPFGAFGASALRKSSSASASAARASPPPLLSASLDRSQRYHGAVVEEEPWQEPQRATDEDDEALVVGGRKGPKPAIGMRVEISPKAAKNRMQRYGETYKNFGGGGMISIVYPGYVWVKWDSGQGHWYNVGLNNEYELLAIVPKKGKSEQERWLEAQQVRVWRPENVRIAPGAFVLKVYGSDEFGSGAMTRGAYNSLEEWWDLLQRERARSAVPGFQRAGILPSP